MNFFNKYKDLFGVPDNTPIPKSKLSVNNNLFIDKTFVPTYQETLSINSKLRDLRKDYNQLEEQIQSINMTMKSPNRTPSRKGAKDLSARKEKQPTFTVAPLQTNRDLQKNKSFLQLDRKNNNLNHVNQSIPLSESQEIKNPFAKKRMTWLKDDQVNLAKHSQINYIFNHKIKQENLRMKNINDVPLPKAENFLFGSVNGNTTEVGKSRVVSNQIYQPAPRPKIIESIAPYENILTNNKKKEQKSQQSDYEGALRRREEAKKNLKSRQQKLGYIYRTSW